ncbi:MAG: thioredoxin family protein [Thermoplasmata archaeon]
MGPGTEMERWGAEAFRGERLDRPGDWGVCFLAEWCPFCIDYLRRFKKLDGAADFPIAVADVTDLESPLWEIFRLDVVPTLVAFRGGTAIWRKDGVHMVGLREEDLGELRAALSRPHPRGTDAP